MIALRARATDIQLAEPLQRNVFKLVDGATLTTQRQSRAYVVAEGETAPPGFQLYLTKGAGAELATVVPTAANAIDLPEPLWHLSGGDVLSVSPSGQRLNVLWRHRSLQNSILLTERCDHYCLMCSQPPREVDDDHLLENAFELVRLLPPDTQAIGFTGGEPTLYGDSLVRLLKLCRNLIPDAGVHVLSNGRRFHDLGFAANWASIANPNLMVGIPIYGAEPALHDYVVQAQGAFNETVRGVLNLGRLRQRIELRVVVHKQTAPHLPEIAEFIARNLPFVEHVAWMGLEMIGFARANMDDVWVDPVEYQPELAEAVMTLARNRIKTMIYNHQLCLLDRRLWPFAVRSISDWKNEYHPECLACSVADRCGGFFFSAKYRYSDHIKAIPAEEAGADRAMLALAE